MGRPPENLKPVAGRKEPGGAEKERKRKMEAEQKLKDQKIAKTFFKPNESKSTEIDSTESASPCSDIPSMFDIQINQ